VTLIDTLESIARLEDLPGLALELRFDPTWHEIGPASFGLDDTSVPRLALVGRQGGLQLIAAQSGQPEAAVQRLARSTSQRGLLALIASFDPLRRRLAFAASVADAPVAVMTTTRLRPVDIRILERGSSHDEGLALSRCLTWADALAGRTLDQRFFRQFRATLSAAVAELPSRIPGRDRHALALLDLTRILFLYFVQERGWLDGRPRFLAEELDRVLQSGGGVARRLLRPLFFGTLNRPIERRSAAARHFGQIPFLNGGLFEPHPLERRWQADLLDGFWVDAFEQLFERYHFTIGSEAGPRAAIGPDMLGRVFEGVMDPDTRKDTGAFYTPSALVDTLIRSSFEAWLAGKLGCPIDEARTELTELTPRALEALRGVTVLDPAAGSGAFLLGALRLLVRLRVRNGEDAATATRSVIASNLFGVDINPNAVHLAELRLWLEVIRADRDAPPEAIPPLPNLDALIRQGDSVLERHDLPVALRSSGADRLGELRNRVLTATGEAKRAAVRALRRAEHDAMDRALEAAIESLERRIRDLVASGTGQSLFGDASTLSRAGRTELRRLRTERSRLRAARRRLVSNGILPWFHFGSQFADLMGRGGFDLIVGNPPWVRAESLSPQEREGLKRRYEWFRARPSSRRGFAPVADLAVAFLQRSLELAHPTGVVGLLLPAKLLTAQYGTLARHRLAERHTIHLAADLPEAAAGFDALVYPLALIVGRGEAAAGHLTATTFNGGGRFVPQDSLSGAPWSTIRSGDSSALIRQTAVGPRLGHQFRIGLGVKTGADAVFVDPKDVCEPELLRPALRGRDIRPFRTVASVRLLWAYDRRGHPLDRLPPLAGAWIGRHRRLLERRADFRSGPLWAVFRTDAVGPLFRVVWADLARQLSATALLSQAEQRTAPLNTCYWLAAPTVESALALTAWLNSEPVRRLARQQATVAASGYFRFNASLVGALPLPAGVLNDAALIAIGKAGHQGKPIDEAALAERVLHLLSNGSA